MAIVGDHPDSGLRFVLERVDGGYDGTVFTPTDRHALVARIALDGTVTVEGDAPAEIREKARLLVRTAIRHAAVDETEPPRRIVRWRP
jgi:hypothetical protein